MVRTQEGLGFHNSVWYSGRASFWGDAYTVRKWTRNLRTNIRKCVQRNSETNDAFQKHLYYHQTIQRNTEMLFANDARFPFTILVCLPWSFASCSLRRVETRFFVYAVRIASMILRTTRFVCVLYAEICVNRPLNDSFNDTSFFQEKFHKQVYGISITSSKSNFATSVIENPEMLQIQQRHIMKQQSTANSNKPDAPPPPLLPAGTSFKGSPLSDGKTHLECSLRGVEEAGG